MSLADFGAITLRETRSDSAVATVVLKGALAWEIHVLVELVFAFYNRHIIKINS